MRKKLLVLVSIFLMLGSFLLINRLQKSNFTVFNDVSAEDIKVIQNTLQETEELGFTALLCNEIRVPFDENTNTFFVPLDMESDQWEKLTFTSGQAEYRILFAENVTSQSKQQVIKEGVCYNNVVTRSFYLFLR